MTQINSYLTFNGNCREAMTFYKECLGGELLIQTIDKSPLSEKMPLQMKECILHSTLSKGNLVIMATDCVREEGLIKGNSVSLCLNCSNEEEINDCYKKLSQGGQQTHPLEDTFWGAVFGGLLISTVTTGYLIITGSKKCNPLNKAGILQQKIILNHKKNKNDKQQCIITQSFHRKSRKGLPCLYRT